MLVTIGVILARRSMYAILNLILLFVLVAFIVISLKVDFIGLIFIIVYVGAIATLFLFIIMMLGGEEWKLGNVLDVSQYHLLLSAGFRGNTFSHLVSRLNWYLKYAAVDMVTMIFVGVVLIQMFDLGVTTYFENWLNVAQMMYTSSLFNGMYAYGIFFYNYWYLPFLIAGVVLLIAMLGSIILTTRLLMVDSKDDKKSSLPDEKDLPPLKPSVLQPLMEKQAREDFMWTWGWPLHLAWVMFCLYFSVMLQPQIVVNSSVALYIWIGGWVILYLMGFAVVRKIINYFF
jgi:NADH:ubiquinone oxidoreductase subunit 6 (subunit J)